MAASGVVTAARSLSLWSFVFPTMPGDGRFPPAPKDRGGRGFLCREVSVSVVVQGREFASKAALERYCRSVVQGYADGDIMREQDGMFFLSLILERHERPQDKIVFGMEDEVLGVRVRHGSGCEFYGKSGTNVNHAFVVYADGHERDFSWKKCCQGFKPEAVATSAMRRAVIGQVVAYKKMRFLAGSVTSDAGGGALDWPSARVDHYPRTFAWLRDSFLAAESITLADVATKSDERAGVVMSDAAMRGRWEAYHDAHKTLRIVSVRENETSWREEGAIR